MFPCFLMEPAANSQRSNRRTKRIAGLAQFAAALGVTKYHLSRVIHGHRASPNLLREFEALRAAEKTAPALGAPVLRAGTRVTFEPLPAGLAAQLAPLCHRDGEAFVIRHPLALVPVTATPESQLLKSGPPTQPQP